MAKLTLLPEETRGTLRPALYGHFIEHLGRCIEEGIWVGEDSAVPNTGGIRDDVAAALRKLAPPVFRWPGGCFADDYHWRDGIGPRAHRPRRVNAWWGGEESNAFGTHEFVDFCRRVGAQPYICLNVGSGSPREAAAWVEYCNYDGDTTLARERAANGAPRPFAVPYWAVGNENWGCGGRLDPDDYAREYRRFACYLRSRSSSPIQLVACGHTTPDWNPTFLEALGDLRTLDHLSIHHYSTCGGAADFSDTEYYNLFARALAVESHIAAAEAALRLYNRTERRIGVIVDEWGAWHPEARRDNGLWQHGTLRDGLVAAALLDAFARHADTVAMANIAQTVNVLHALCQTDGPAMWLTPTYHVFRLYKEHMGRQAIRVGLDDVPTVEARGADGRRVALPVLSASASFDQEKGTVALTVQNLHLEDPVECRIALPRGSLGKAAARILTAGDVRQSNDAQAPRRVRVRRFALETGARSLRATLPPHALVGIRMALA